MRNLCYLLPLLLATGCTRFLDQEGLGRSMIDDKDSLRTVGADGEARLSQSPGDPYYRGEGTARQVHVYSPQRGSTTVVDGRALRQGRVVPLSSYPGAPPPPKRWVRGRR